MKRNMKIWILPVCTVLQFYGLGAQDGVARATKAGELTVQKGYPVLRLFGEDVKERGFAHGWFLAGKVIECVDDALRSLPSLTPEKFEEDLLPWAENKFHWSAETIREMDGIFEGMQARLGEKGLVCPVLKRPLTRRDLYGINAIADRFGPACSGFTAWKSRTVDGQVFHGRNLDFPLGGRAVADQVVLAVAALPIRKEWPARKAWIGVGWPGLVGVYSAMNADGLVCCLHDANNVLQGEVESGFANRGILLRRIVEMIDPAKTDAAVAAAQLAAERPAACGNLFHLSWPGKASLATKTGSCAILEFDASGRSNGGTPVSIRRMNGDDFLVLTNHYCVRAKELKCDRYERITAAIDKYTDSGKKIDLNASKKILMGGEQEIMTVAHSIVFQPDTLMMQVAISRGNRVATRIKGVEYSFDELMRPSNGTKLEEATGE